MTGRAPLPLAGVARSDDVLLRGAWGRASRDFDVPIRGGPAGGGYSTVEDLHRFARALQTGRPVQPATFALMIAPRPELASPTYGYRFGLNDDGSIGHAGGFPGISSALAFCPDTGHVVVVLSNFGRASGPVVRKAAELLR
jgi:CubicO group peptidase (beta-lactamase class C family)